MQPRKPLNLKDVQLQIEGALDIAKGAESLASSASSEAASATSAASSAQAKADQEETKRLELEADQVIVDFKALTKAEVIAMTDGQRWEQVFKVLKALVREVY